MKSVYKFIFKKLIIFSFITSIVFFAQHLNPSMQKVEAATTNKVFTGINTNKAMYTPGSTVSIYVDLKNNTGAKLTNATITLYFKHLNSEVSAPSVKTFTLSSGATTTLTWTWTPPSTDFRGYMIEAWARNSSGTILDNINTAVDVSSTWTKFPRYGYLSKFPSQTSTTSTNINWQLKNYHINALQYYDWQYKHHVPLAGTVSNPASSWKDIANRTSYRQTVLDLINAGHSYNMAAMNYNLGYGAYSGYGEDGSGVNYQWGLFNDQGHTSQYNVPLPSGWATSNIWLFNPGNTSWQDYIINKERDVFNAYPFDGWQIDQLGDPGTKYDINGNVVNMAQGFQSLTNNAKTSLNKTIILNNVGNYAQDQIATSSADVLYTEMWEGSGGTTYNDLRNVIEYGQYASNYTKAVVIAGYMNYDYAKTKSTSNPGYFNEAGVLLADSAIFASGGSHIELGDDTRMLCNEYFPNTNLIMTTSLKSNLQRYYDFSVAYENLLRYGQVNIPNVLYTENFSSSASATSGKIWTMAKWGYGYDILHFINLSNQNSINWRDTNANYPVPTIKSNVIVKYYIGSGTVNSVNWASPDVENGKSTSLSFTTGSDTGGNFIRFTLPSLKYWDMVYIKKN